jgi:hypothetical protein
MLIINFWLRFCWSITEPVVTEKAIATNEKSKDKKKYTQIKALS